jgi:hypothetical protein
MKERERKREGGMREGKEEEKRKGKEKWKGESDRAKRGKG